MNSDFRNYIIEAAMLEDSMTSHENAHRLLINTTLK